MLVETDVAHMRDRLGSSRMTGFCRAASTVVLLAEQSAGFLWRYQTVVDEVRGIASGPDAPLLVNVSAWTDPESLHAFTYPGLHGKHLSARQRWFIPIPGRTTALWWRSDEDRPSVDRAIIRLLHLRDHGITPQAFTVRRRFPPPTS